MIELWIERADVNVDLLDAQLREVSEEGFYGLSTGRGGVTLYISDTLDTEQRQQLIDIARAHDATALTPQQQAALARYEMLEQGRADEALDMAAYAQSSVEIHTLAQKIAWLEQELRDLRGI